MTTTNHPAISPVVDALQRMADHDPSGPAELAVLLRQLRDHVLPQLTQALDGWATRAAATQLTRGISAAATLLAVKDNPMSVSLRDLLGWAADDLEDDPTWDDPPVREGPS